MTLTVQVASDNDAIKVDSSIVTLAPGASVRVPVGFNCSTTTSFTSMLTPDRRLRCHDSLQSV